MVRTGGIAHPLDQQHALRQIHARDRRLHRRFAESILPNPPARLPTAVLSLDRSEIALPASRRTCRLRCRTDHQDTHRIETYAGDGAGQPEKDEELNEAKISFFTTISHELRTPLTLLLAPIDQLKAYETNSSKLKNYQLIERNAKTLLSLVNQILDFRKTKRGRSACRWPAPTSAR